MDMQNVCKEILDEVDGSLGCIVIDMQTGLTVAGEYRQGTLMNPATVNLVSVVSTNMFHGKLIRQFEGALAGPYGGPGSGGPSGFVREVQMTTEQTNQFMAAIPGWEQGLLVLVTDKTVSVGLGWMAVHRVIGQLGEAPRTVAALHAAGRFPAEQRPAATPVAPAFPQRAAPVPPANEPFPDANRYAPPPVRQPLARGGIMPHAPAARVAAPAVGPPAVNPQPAPPQDQPAEPAPEKKRPALGPRVAMFRRK